MAKTTTTPDSSKAEAEPKEGAKQETLVERTPVGLSAEQMKKSNPEAVQRMQEEAASKAKKESAKALSEMKAAFSDDLEFAIAAHSEGLSVEQAKAKRYDAVIKENQNLKAENANFKQDSEDLEIKFAPAGEKTSSAPDEELSAEAIENAAADAWNKLSQAEKAEFGNVKTAFFAYYKMNPDEFKQNK
ncbi:hypothetical protein [Gimesia fumaroli]|uniref:Uncharacterized protein n=1 Tax=Gimesia fumaroli TaxID=2527976 RepID=A0A518ICM6_9PLAN|nr:hypothetical protein [Gimesia fumaroli]QDV50847.1 hypothetical protein Enr17x_28920 [Gimesia fumaroli]